MPPILDLIAERETAAHAAVAALRDQITALTDQLTRAETELTELAITRKILIRLTTDTETTTPLDTTVASGPYQRILAVFATATNPIRAKDVCLALDTTATARDAEKMRARLKRLVARKVLSETEPGMFTLTPTPPT